MTETLNKVSRITLWFWLMKILATTLGETSGDLLSMTLNLGYAEGLLVTLAFFLTVLLIQLTSSRFHLVIYWLVIVGTTAVGTEISDFMDRTLLLGYAAGSSMLLAALILTLGVWRLQIGTISVYPISSTKEEFFYWTAILISNSLGTAFGDFLSDNVGLSYLDGALVTAGIIIVVIILHERTTINRMVLFWIAFVFTRPFGATFGDLLTKSHAQGGLNLGTISATLITTMLLASLLVYVGKKQGVSDHPAVSEAPDETL